MDEKITYGALIRHYRQEMREAGKSSSTISNQVSRLKRFMAFAGRADGDPIRVELEDDEAFTRIRDQVIEDGAASNQRAMRSTLQAWRKSYRRLVRQTELPERFADTLRVLVDRSVLSQNAIARSAGIPEPSFHQWVNGTFFPQPTEKNSRRVVALEEVFGIDRGSLAEKLGKAGLVGKNSQPNPNLLSAHVYKLPESDLPAPLETEIRNLVRHKTDAFLGGKKRNSIWRLRPSSGYGAYVPDLARVGDQVCPTAHILTSQVLRLFGFLLEEKKWSLEDLRLVHCTDPELLHSFICFLKDRRGRFTNNAIEHLDAFSSLIQPEWGYITQSPHMADHIHPPISQADWSTFCADRYDQIIRMKKELKKSGQVRAGRKPQDPIERILEHPEPASWLFTLVSRMEENFALRASPRIPIRTAVDARNIVLVKLLTLNPLRVNQLITMIYRVDNTGNLRRKQDGSWQLVYEPWEFKNERGAAKETYRADIHPWVAESIEQYLIDHRPVLLGTEESDYFFLSRHQRWTQKGPEKNQFSGISRTIRDITRTYLKEVAPKGFGPHAFRHIIATHYLKCHPGNYPLVAQILHDKLKTVMDVYGHLQVGDGLSAWAETVQGHIKNGGKHDRASL